MAATRPVPASDPLTTADPNELRELRARVTALEADRERMHTRINELLGRVSTLERQARRHEDADRELMAAIVRATSGTAFNAGEVLEHAEIDPTLRRCVRGLNAKQLGHRLAALEGRPLGGFVIRRVGRDHDGTVWTVAVYLPFEMQQDPCAPGEDGA
jgi:hypothetical protein